MTSNLLPFASQMLICLSQQFLLESTFIFLFMWRSACLWIGLCNDAMWQITAHLGKRPAKIVGPSCQQARIYHASRSRWEAALRAATDCEGVKIHRFAQGWQAVGSNWALFPCLLAKSRLHRSIAFVVLVHKPDQSWIAGIAQSWQHQELQSSSARAELALQIIRSRLQGRKAFSASLIQYAP